MSVIVKEKTYKEFREFLNEKFKDYPQWKHNRYHQKTRGYGDYLYFQDRILFDVNYNEWIENPIEYEKTI